MVPGCIPRSAVCQRPKLLVLIDGRNNSSLLWISIDWFIFTLIHDSLFTSNQRKQDGGTQQLVFFRNECKNSNSDYYSRVNCPSCSELEYLLKDANIEISSLQYIYKLLYKELHHGATTSIEREWSRTAP